MNISAKNLTVLSVLFCLALPAAAQQQAVIAKGSVLTLSQCLDTALKNNPQIASSKAEEQTQHSKLWQARGSYLPQINANAAYTRANQETATGYSGADDSYSSSISATQLIYDFGATSGAVDVQKKSYLSAKEDSRSTENNIAYSVKQAYYGLLSAQDQRDVYKQSVDDYEQQLKRAQGFYEVGTKPKIDVTTAQVNLNQAKLNLIGAENSLKVAYRTLLNAMGLSDETTDFTLEKSDTVETYDITLEDALKQAGSNRPDLEKYKLSVESAKANLTIARTDFAPELNANASYGWSGQNYPLYDKWSFGAGISLPIFSGFSSYNKVQAAKSGLQKALANLNNTQQTATLEVNTAYLDMTKAKEAIPVADLSRQEAQESYDLAAGRYTVGVGDYIEVKDAEVSLSNAKLSYINAVYDYDLAVAKLKNVMGTK